MKVSHKVYYDREFKCDVVKSLFVLDKFTCIGMDNEKFIKAKHTAIFREKLYGDVRNKILSASAAIRAGDKEGADKRLTEALNIIVESVK